MMKPRAPATRRLRHLRMATVSRQQTAPRDRTASRSTRRPCSPRRSTASRSRAAARGTSRGGGCAGTTSRSRPRRLRRDRRRLRPGAAVRAPRGAHRAERRTTSRDNVKVDGDEKPVISQGGTSSIRRRTSSRQGRHDPRPDVVAAPAAGSSSARTATAATSRYGCSTAAATRSRSASARRSICTFFAIILALLAGYFGGWSDWMITRFFDLIWAFPVVLLGDRARLRARDQRHQLGADQHRERKPLDPDARHLVRADPVHRPAAARADPLAAREGVRRGRRSRRARARCASCSRRSCRTSQSSVLVFFTLIIATNILTEAALSFLGAGVQPPNPSWGTLIAEGQAAHHDRAVADARARDRDRADRAVAEHLRRRPARRARPAREGQDRALMLAFVVRRFIGMILVLLRRELLRVPDLHRRPRRRPGDQDRRPHGDRPEHREHPQGLGLRPAVLRPVLRHDEEGVHEQPRTSRRTRA